MPLGGEKEYYATHLHNIQSFTLHPRTYSTLSPQHLCSPTCSRPRTSDRSSSLCFILILRVGSVALA
jgi:hypothetical protein